MPVSLLRYPGGKTRAVKHIVPLLPRNTETLISPFFGGGSIEITMAQQGVKVEGSDIFSQLVTFWKEALGDPGKLADEVQKFLPLKKEEFYSLQKKLASERMSDLETATAFFVLNRASFSGTTLSGGMGPGHLRFTQSAIDSLRAFSCPNLRVTQASFEVALGQPTDETTSVYLDPPYLLEQSNLYGNKGETHRNFSHMDLFDCIRDKKRWLMSYNDCAEIRRVYAGFRIVEPAWSYGMGNSKKSSELLIFSKEFEEWS